MTKMAIPDRTKVYPRSEDKQIVYLKNVITNPNIEVGDFTFYNDFVNDPKDFEKNNVLYHYPINRDKLIIGKFCSIACGAKFCLTVRIILCAHFRHIRFRFSMKNGNTEFGQIKRGIIKVILLSVMMYG